MSFIEERFPVGVKLGFTGGPRFSTSVTTTDSGHTQRNQNWAESLGKWDLQYPITDKATIATVQAFFYNTGGRASGFRMKDWTDFEGLTENLGTGDAAKTVFQIVKIYTTGAVTHTRTIKKIVSGTLSVFLDAVPQNDPGDYSVDLNTGLITFVSAPGAGVVVTATYEFDAPVAFADDHLAITAHTDGLMSLESMPIEEIKI